MSTASVVAGRQLSPGDLLAIGHLVQQAQDAQGDVHALLALHTDWAVIVNLAGRRVLGAAAFADAMRSALRSQLGADAAVVSCLKTVYDERADTGSDQHIPTTGAVAYGLVKTDTAWRIALAQTNPMIA